MSERYDTGYPEDEPVIGGTGFEPPQRPLTPPGQPRYIGAAVADDFEEPEIGYAEPLDDEYDEEPEFYDEDDEYGYYDEDYDEEIPARQPMFYVFVALAALVGGLVVFLLFSLVNNGGEGGGGGATGFAVRIDSPVKDKRVEIGKTEEVIVQASATQPIALFELFVGDRLADSLQVTETPPDNKYIATLQYTLPAKGNYDLKVKITTSTGETKESDKVRVIAIEPVGERPQTIRGKVVADTTLRTGPGDQFPESTTLKAGEEVTILGKDRQVNWLLVETAAGPRWARRNAIEEFDSLDLVQVREPTATPRPTQEPTSTQLPSPSPSASASPSPSANAPDFVPVNAVLIDGGTVLRVTIQNVSTNAYDGALVVGVSGDVNAPEVAVAAKLAANGGSATIDFEVNPPITATGKKAVVSVDPKNAVREGREDNNSATFVLLPPEEEPKLEILAPTVQAAAIAVTIRNSGGAMPATTVQVRVKVGASEASQSQTIALAKGQTANFSVSKPGTGAATVEVVINGQVVATANITIDS